TCTLSLHDALRICCVSDNAPTTNFVNSDSKPLPITAGKNMSAKPTSIVGAASVASGMRINSSNGTIGAEMKLKIGVNSAMINASAPKLITSGIRPNQISNTVSTPSCTCFFQSLDVLALSIACCHPHFKGEMPSGIDSSIIGIDASKYVSSFRDNGGIRGIIIAATILATV